MPRRPWDETTPVCVLDDDRYFWSADEVEDYCEDEGCDVDDLMLVHCAPVYAHQLDPGNIYADSLYEDGDVPTEIEAAFNELNRTISGCREPLSWAGTGDAVDWHGGEE